MTKTIDQNLLDVMAALPRDWKIQRFQRAGMGWTAGIGKGEAELFHLVEDRFYISVEKIVSG